MMDQQLELLVRLTLHPINITPLSAGITTVGIDTNQFNVNNLDVSGISTFAGNISLHEK